MRACKNEETGGTFARQDLEPGFTLEPHGLAQGAALPVARRVARMGKVLLCMMTAKAKVTWTSSWVGLARVTAIKNGT